MFCFVFFLGWGVSFRLRNFVVRLHTSANDPIERKLMQMTLDDTGEAFLYDELSVFTDGNRRANEQIKVTVSPLSPNKPVKGLPIIALNQLS